MGGGSFPGFSVLMFVFERSKFSPPTISWSWRHAERRRSVLIGTLLSVHIAFIHGRGFPVFDYVVLTSIVAFLQGEHTQSPASSAGLLWWSNQVFGSDVTYTRPSNGSSQLRALAMALRFEVRPRRRLRASRCRDTLSVIRESMCDLDSSRSFSARSTASLADPHLYDRDPES